SLLYPILPPPPEPNPFPYTTLFRSRACHRKSGLPDLRHFIMRNSGKPEFLCHPRLPSLLEKKNVDARNKSEHDDKTNVPREDQRSEEHTSELQSRGHLVCRLLLEKK